MALLNPSPGSYKFQLAAGETLSITTDANSVCRYTQLSSAPVADSLGTPISVPANSAITVGPRGDVSRWLVDSVIGGGVTVVQNPASAVPDSGAPADLMHLYGAGAPSAATGANQAAIGSLYTDTAGAKLYINGGTKATPSWRIVTSA
jgi:hypothetical protein